MIKGLIYLIYNDKGLIYNDKGLIYLIYNDKGLIYL